MADAALLSLANNYAMAAVQLLNTRAIDEMKLAWGLKDELEKLKAKFSDIQSFLQDVGSAKHADRRSQVNDWLQKVKDAAYFADDIMDDYAYEILRREHEENKRFKKQFLAFFTRYNPIIFRIKMSHKVRDAIATFDELESKAQSIGLKQVDMTRDGMAGTWADNGDGSMSLRQARQHAAADATEFVGRADDEKKLLEMLCHPSNQDRQISTIAIVGLGDQICVDQDVEVEEHEFVAVLQSVAADEFCSIVESEFTPFVKQHFIDIGEGLKFYKMYALASGFDVRKYTTKRWRDGTIRSKLLVCNREGSPYSKKQPAFDLNVVAEELTDEEEGTQNGCTQRRNTKILRIGCKARLRLFMLNGVLTVDQFHAGHNHELVDIKDRQFQKLSRKFQASTKESTLDNTSFLHLLMSLRIRIDAISARYRSLVSILPKPQSKSAPT